MKHAIMMPLILIVTAVICVLRLYGETGQLYKDAAHMHVAGLIGALIVVGQGWWQFRDLTDGADPCDRWATPHLRRAADMWRLWCLFLVSQVSLLILTESLAASGLL